MKATSASIMVALVDWTIAAIGEVGWSIVWFRLRGRPESGRVCLQHGIGDVGASFHTGWAEFESPEPVVGLPRRRARPVKSWKSTWM